MYSYEWDPETGGYILNTTPLAFSKEPRPVYYQELDILGFDKYWKYEKDDSKPYMWAESSSYFYRGRLVAKTVGGNLYTAPQLQIFEDNPELQNEGKLRFVDIEKMVEKNRTVLDALVNETIKNVYHTYMQYKDKVDIFYVAFSGGKDSIVLLDIVQRALPHNQFRVIFGDTGMENSDTDNYIKHVESNCKKLGIKFDIAKSHLDVDYTWEQFGYPSAALRWCCSVHKTTPQMILIRQELNKANFKGMAFIGVRKDESLTRAKYDTLSEGEKHEGQYGYNAIDDWNSAEIYLYIYQNQLALNESYKKGNSRVGCLVCPMSSGKHEYMKRVSYTDRFDFFINKIKGKSNRQFETVEKENDFLSNGGWKVRNNGRDLKIDKVKYDEKYHENKYEITISKNSQWQEWMKTIGTLIKQSEHSYSIMYKDKRYRFEIVDNIEKLIFTMDFKPLTQYDIKFISIFKAVLKKSTYCINCKVCESNCSFGCIKMDNGVEISDECVHCFKCHKIDSGCLLYNSIKVLKGVEQKMSLDSYASFGVEKEWIIKYLAHGESFWTSEYNDLGSMKITALKRFLRDANIKLGEDKTRDMAEKMVEALNRIGINSQLAWAIILTNLSYTPQLNWYVKNIKVGSSYIPDEIKNMLGENVTKGSKGNIVSSLKNILTKTPLGEELGLGICDIHKSKSGSKETLNSITRSCWKSPSPEVILYGLYKFAEACGDYYQFTLNRLMNYNIDSNGVSPSLIFGLDRETMEGILMGLSMKYPEFINASFTHDLDNITLRPDKKSIDVLNLF